MPKIGYARVSTRDQHPELQIQALEKAGCERIFTDTSSGAKMDRVELTKALDYARAGDEIVVWRLDRLGRNTLGVLQLLADLKDRGIAFVSLTESFDTQTAIGQALLIIAAAFAEMERQLIRERTMAGLAVAIANGKHGGRPAALNAQQIARVRQRYAEGVSVSDLAKIFECGRATIYRAVTETQNT